MKRTTAIEWTEHTWNPFVGCSLASHGCKNCYAMSQASRLDAYHVPAYKGTTKKHNGKTVWTGQLNRSSDRSMNKPYTISGNSYVFVNSMSDFFHENAKPEWQLEALSVMKDNPNHVFQILTKRPLNAVEFLHSTGATLCSNIWLGVTVESHKTVDRIDALRSIPCELRFVSFEPLISSVGSIDLKGIHWAISGGESGSNCRECHVDWVREIDKACKAAGVPHFFKQWGHPRNNPLSIDVPSGMTIKKYIESVDPTGKGGSLLDGQYIKQMPFS